VEGIFRNAAVRNRIGERADHGREVLERPAVHQDQRQRIGLGRADMQEMHTLPIDFGDELRIPVPGRLLRPPVEAGAPVLGQLPHVAGRDAVGPADAGQLVGPAGGGQPPAQILEVGVRDVDAKGSESRHVLKVGEP
jgi:hypothetical protein